MRAQARSPRLEFKRPEILGGAAGAGLGCRKATLINVDAGHTASALAYYRRAESRGEQPNDCGKPAVPVIDAEFPDLESLKRPTTRNLRECDDDGEPNCRQPFS